MGCQFANPLSLVSRVRVFNGAKQPNGPGTRSVQHTKGQTGVASAPSGWWAHLYLLLYTWPEAKNLC